VLVSTEAVLVSSMLVIIANMLLTITNSMVTTWHPNLSFITQESLKAISMAILAMLYLHQVWFL
jgi:hypothetical protein